jgi:hypothetical protein
MTKDHLSTLGNVSQVPNYFFPNMSCGMWLGSLGRWFFQLQRCRFCAFSRIFSKNCARFVYFLLSQLNSAAFQVNGRVSTTSWRSLMCQMCQLSWFFVTKSAISFSRQISVVVLIINARFSRGNCSGLAKVNSE